MLPGPAGHELEGLVAQLQAPVEGALGQQSSDLAEGLHRGELHPLVFVLYERDQVGHDGLVNQVSACDRGGDGVGG